MKGADRALEGIKTGTTWIVQSQSHLIPVRPETEDPVYCHVR
jgi:hypothetical protein